MNRAFRNSSQVECIFTDEGVTFGGVEQEVFLPYGSIDAIHMSLLGVLQATSHTRICSFVVDRGDRAEMKEMIRFAREAIKTAPKAEPRVLDLSSGVDGDLSPEEQLKACKALFVQGVISKEEYDARKRRLKENV